MSKIIAAVIPEPRKPVELREVPQPQLEKDSALLAVTYSEVCGTDVHLWEGRLEGVPYPLIPGHVNVGTLAKIRGRITDVQGRELREGQSVTFLDVHATCGKCWYCLVAKASTRCPQRKVYGITYGLQDGPCGGWASHVYLKPDTRVLPLDSADKPPTTSAVDPKLYMAAGCSMPTAMHAVERAQIHMGDIVLVLGSGPVGLSCVALAKRAGAGRVLCVGAPQSRLDTAIKMGADAVLDINAHETTQRAEWVGRQSQGRGPDITIEAAGQPEAVVQAMRWTRDAGKVAVVGQYTDLGQVSFNPHLDLNRKHLTILGVWGCDFSHVHRGLEILRQTGPDGPWGQIPCDMFDLGQAQQALEEVAAGRVVKALLSPKAET